MISPISKILAVIVLLLILSTGWYYIQYNKQLTENEVLRSNVSSLTTSIDTQKSTIESLQLQQDQLNNSVMILSNNNDRLNAEASKALSEINTLRSTLLQRSIENPFAVSNINTESWQVRKRGIVGGINNE